MRNKIKVWDRDSVTDRSSGINQVRKRIVNFWPFSFTTRIVKFPAILINTGIFPVLCLICFGTILNIIILIIICEIVYLIFIFNERRHSRRPSKIFEAICVRWGESVHQRRVGWRSIGHLRELIQWFDNPKCYGNFGRKIKGKK